MNEDTMAGAWKQLRGKMKEVWGKLTEDDLDQAEGKWDHLSGVIQSKYGKGRDDVERDIERFRREYDRYAHRPGGALTTCVR